MGFIEAILNRLRGTGVIKHFGTTRVDEIKLWKFTIPKMEVNVNLVWSHIYALYLALIVGLLTMNAWVGLLVLIAYLVGESKGWGEWVGSLTRVEPFAIDDLLRNYKDEEGRGFPYIHKIANWIEPEKGEFGTLEDRVEQYLKYAKVALMIRGLYWWGLVYGAMFCFGLVNVYEYIAIVAILGIGFPIACEIGKMITSSGKVWKIEWSQGWENQELVYGLMQGICLWYVILKVVYE